MSTPSEAILAGLGETLLEQAGPLLPELVGALAAPLDHLAEVIASYADLDATEQPNLLGQLAATLAPNGLEAADQVDWIRAHPRWHRGTPTQIVQAVRDLLGPNAIVQITERDTSPWKLTVRVYMSQLAGHSIDEVRAAVMTQKPAGILLDVFMIPEGP